MDRLKSVPAASQGPTVYQPDTVGLAAIPEAKARTRTVERPVDRDNVPPEAMEGLEAVGTVPSRV